MNEIANKTDLTAAIEAERLAAIQTYRQLVQDRVHGRESLGYERIKAICAAVGKTLDDLTRDESIAQDRIAWRQQASLAASIAPGEAATLTKKIQTADSDLESAIAALQQQHAELTTPIHQRLEEISIVVSAARTAKARLRQTCDDPQLLTAHAANAAELIRVSAERDAVWNVVYCGWQDILRSAEAQELELGFYGVRNAEHNPLATLSGMNLRTIAMQKKEAAEAAAPRLAELEQLVVNLQAVARDLEEKMSQ